MVYTHYISWEGTVQFVILFCSDRVSALVRRSFSNNSKKGILEGYALSQLYYLLHKRNEMREIWISLLFMIFKVSISHFH
jgi:hypothetical protein